MVTNSQLLHYRRKHPAKQGFVPRAVGTLIPKVTKRSLSRHGFRLYNLANDWSNIVGSTWGQTTCPQKVTFKPYGILHVRVDSGSTALLFKHAEPQILDRINSYFGYAAIRAIKCIQSPRPQTSKQSEPHNSRKRKVPPRHFAPPKDLESIQSQPLKEALSSFYQALASRDNP